jgi:hypothetical protein
MILGYLRDGYIVCLCVDKCDPGVSTIVLELFERLAKEGLCSLVINSTVDRAGDLESF